MAGSIPATWVSWISEGRLKITDRKKEIIITSGGKNIAPSEIENRLKCSPYINEAIVIGDGRKYLTALIQIEYDNVAKWAQERGIAYTTFKSLAQNPEVYELIKQEVNEANKEFAQVETVKKFRLLEKELDHDDDELTATLKLRRKTIYKKFGHIIEEMYGARSRRYDGPVIQSIEALGAPGKRSRGAHRVVTDRRSRRRPTA